MKRTTILLFALILSVLNANAQSNEIYGSRWTGAEDIFMSLDIPSQVYSDIATLGGVLSLASGESTFAADSGLWYRRTNLGIISVDILTGAIIDTIPNPDNMKGIEYDKTSHKLYGSRWTGAEEIFVVLDIVTKTYTDITILGGVTSLASGVSTFSADSARWYRSTNLGIISVDILTGAIVDTVPNPDNMKGIEYDTGLGMMFGSRWTGADEVFVSLDLTTQTYTDIATLGGVSSLASGESTYDGDSSKWYRSTNLGIIAVDVLTGAITDTIANPDSMKGIEYHGTPPPITTELIKNDTEHECLAYPNPTTGLVNLSLGSLYNNVAIEIYNLSGQVVFASSYQNSKDPECDLGDLETGIYIVKINTEDRSATIRLIKE